ncbi:translation initiation factor 2 [Streptomyces albus subsp. chlorinus]|uniref:translation initiation factor 2 n=1 Tax=Streptomyces albus TaxID=1888 RepID=UPI00156DA8FA|nr:translation initiation factor 2 [Streptomyces albus subsp. chlorinus]
MRDVLFVVRTATTLHRLLDAAPALAGDRRIRPYVTLVPGSEFSADALAALEELRALQLPWEEATRRSFALVLAASARGALHLLRGPLTLLPHGAGYGKRVPAPDGSTEAVEDAANGLHPGQLLRPDGTPLARLHALAHPSQYDRLVAHSPAVAAPAAVVGDPTLDRLLESLPRRRRYRRALGTGRRALVVTVSTWGAESLLERRPGLPLRLATELPYDAYQTALVLHPNEHVSKGRFGLSQDLTPERRAGVLLPRPYEEWAAVLVAADCVISDHGSTALYAAALGLPVLNAYDGGRELLPGTPVSRLLAAAPRLAEHLPYGPQLRAAMDGHRPESVREAAGEAFARCGNALTELRERLYTLLGLSPPPVPAEPDPLPVPLQVAKRSPAPTAFAVDSEVAGETVRVARRPASGQPGDHLAAEEDWAGLRHVRSAGLLYRRTVRADAVAEWSAGVLAAYPGCRTAAAVLAPDTCVLRVRGRAGLLTVRIEPDGAPPDPVAVLCGVHAWLAKEDPSVHTHPAEAAHPRPARRDTAVPSGRRVRCEVGGLRAVAVLSPAEGDAVAGDAVAGDAARGGAAESGGALEDSGVSDDAAGSAASP